MLPYNKKLTSNARALRKNMTPEEKHLWYDFLRHLPVPVKRQYNIENYIVDFYIASAKLVIEVDGRQHLMKENATADAERDAVLAHWGITVARYTDMEINQNFRAVTDDILKKLAISYEMLKL